MPHRIGIVDWGIGGMGLFRILQQKGVSTVYLSDAGYTPYGKVSAEELAQRWQQIIHFFNEQEIKHIAVACNALSTVVNDSPEHLTVIDTACKQVKQLSISRLGIIGGERTINSGVYEARLAAHCTEVKSNVAQPLSALVEQGIIAGEEVEQKIQEIIGPIADVSHLLLACTHYPVLSETIHKAFPDLKLIDPADAMAQDILAEWDVKAGDSDFYTTGSTEALIINAKKAFGVEVKNCDQIVLK